MQRNLVNTLITYRNDKYFRLPVASRITSHFSLHPASAFAAALYCMLLDALYFGLSQNYTILYYIGLILSQNYTILMVVVSELYYTIVL